MQSVKSMWDPHTEFFVLVQCYYTDTMHYCCRALFRTAEGHITRLLALSMEVSVATWGRRARRRGGLSDVSLQACVFWQTFS